MEKKIRHEFKIPKQLNNTGAYIKNNAGDIVYDTLVYDFEEMGWGRKAQAEIFFRQELMYFVNLPQSPEHVNYMAHSELGFKALSAILMRKSTNKEYPYEIYNPDTTKLSPWDLEHLAKTVIDTENIMECKADFFGKMGLQIPESIMQSTAILNPFQNLMRQFAEQKTNLGIESWQEMIPIMETVFGAAANMTKSTT
jgi:hypothetical protein